MARKTGFTLEQHKETGAGLADLRDRLVLLSVGILNAYPDTHKACREIRKALAALDAARSALDGQVFKERPDVGHDLAFLYYPNRASE